MRIEGTLYWVKLDKPRPNYNKQKKIMKDGEPDGWGDETSFVLGNLTKETKLALRDAGLLDKVKDKMDDQGAFITFRLSTHKRDGTANDPIRVVNAATGQDWNFNPKTGEGLIGNLSKGVCAFNVWRSKNGKASIYPVSLLVTEHVEYEQEEGGGGDYEDPNDWSEYIKQPAETKAKTPAAKPKTKPAIAEDLDDDIPF